MTDTNGVKTCVLLARVSNRHQAKRGLSLPAQLRELREWARRESYRVVAEVAAEGGKGSKRHDFADGPDAERIYDVCEAQSVGYVVVQDWERFGHEETWKAMARRLATFCDTRIRTISDPNDEDDEAAEVLRMMKGWTSKRSLRDTAKRSRSRKLEHARRGYVVAGHTPTYGFRYVGTKKERTYEVEEDRMEVVRRIFEMVGVEGLSNRAVANRLNNENVPTPPAPVKRKHPDRLWGWDSKFVRRCVLNDAHKPHTREEVAALVRQGHMAPEAAARAPVPCGVWWYEGKDYEGNEHRVAVPVPSSGIPRETVDAARSAIANNVPMAAGDGRYWELLGGILRCAGCGLRMQAHVVTRGERVYEYLRCPQKQRTASAFERCPVNARLLARQAEEAVWGFVAGLLSEPERVVSGLDDLIERERDLLRGDPEKEMRDLRRDLQDLDLRRERAQDAYLAGAFTVNELRARQQQLEDAKERVMRDMHACENRGARLRALEDTRRMYAEPERWARDLLAERFDNLACASDDVMRMQVSVLMSEETPEAIKERRRQALDGFTPEQRREKYEKLGLRVDAHGKDKLEVSGLFEKETIYTCA